ncbi:MULTISPECIES: hypothetical protein [unclassified Methanoregula]|uniref:hypothetical protein n=1 Tax=unclassified Methanoregula TaxID=2649730 RepID=UPI0009D0D5C3|nr:MULTISPECIES: hypothetical protein [unclassified Methanoregula]OPX62939.1 MAG: hypothetical protein A4E33_02069 [Methanoregula sp. PtaB.Bin085]OPY35152.1 MAG: hypothetical protein A4E34_00958 [Methanoregula sp. PtaU1.Bin006]
MTDKNNADEQLYDVLVPPGVPQTIIVDITKKFKVKVVERKEKLSFANMEGDERNLLAFRGKLEVVQEVEKYMKDELRKFIEK